MKKLVLILLITIYALSSFGVSVKEFYCCGKLKSVSVSLADVAKSKNGETAGKDNCCKTQYQSFKVKDNHVAADNYTLPQKSCIDLFTFVPVYNSISLVSQEIDVANSVHAPPLYVGVPVYIANCVFRI